MAKLLGQDGTGWTRVEEGEQSSAGNATVYNVVGSGYAGTPGTATSASIDFGTNAAGTAGNVKIVVYDASGNLVATSAAIAATSGLQSGSISFAVTSQNYGLVVVPDTGYFNVIRNSGSSNFSNQQFVAAHFSYASPPSVRPAADTSTGAQFIVYISGTVTGGGSSQNGADMMRGCGS